MKLQDSRHGDIYMSYIISNGGVVGMYNDNIDIFLITYNRENDLKRTVERLLAGGSPIKDYEIKILDNASTDGTKLFCEEVALKHSNIQYIRNRINIGISGNIIKAMELASKKWMWVLCDNDDYEWSNWSEVVEALEEGEFDIVHTTFTQGKRNETYPYLINEEAFLPTSIYNTKHITSQTMHNAYGIAYTLLPHQAIGCKVINEKGRIFTPKNRTVIQGSSDKYNYFRISEKGLFHRFTHYQILASYIAVYQLIEDREIRRECCETLCLGFDFEYAMGKFLEWNDGYINNLADVLIAIDSNQKQAFFRALESQPQEKGQSLCDFIAELYPYIASQNKLL